MARNAWLGAVRRGGRGHPLCRCRPFWEHPRSAVLPRPSRDRADEHNHCIQKFTAAGVFVRKWGKNGGDGSSGSGDGEFSHPADVIVGGHGRVFVAAWHNHRIVRVRSLRASGERQTYHSPYYRCPSAYMVARSSLPFR